MFQLLNCVSKCKRWPRHGTNHPATDGILSLWHQTTTKRCQEPVIFGQFWMKKLESISPTAFFFMDTATTTRWMVQDFCQLPIILQSLHRLICNCTKCLGFSPRAGTTMDSTQSGPAKPSRMWQAGNQLTAEKLASQKDTCALCATLTFFLKCAPC